MRFLVLKAYKSLVPLVGVILTKLLFVFKTGRKGWNRPFSNNFHPIRMRVICSYDNLYLTLDHNDMYAYTKAI